MAGRVNWVELGMSVLSAAGFGVALGLGAVSAAKAMGWPTGFMGPLTGGLVIALTAVIYQMRARNRRAK